MNIEKYWNSKILEWEDSMIKEREISVVERLASYFRKPLLFRSQICMELIAPKVTGKDILELGCGSGYFSFKLFEKSKPRSITGIDISNEAIKRASKIAEETFGRNNIFEFKVSDIVNSPMKSCHLTMGLGLLDYLTKDEIANLFARINSRYYLFTFPEKKFSLFRLIHIIYMTYQRCPKHFYYTKSDMKECCESKFSECYFINHRKLSFGCIMHNLPNTD
jgi:SAM-dependent methyltransferase